MQFEPIVASYSNLKPAHSCFLEVLSFLCQKIDTLRSPAFCKCTLLLGINESLQVSIQPTHNSLSSFSGLLALTTPDATSIPTQPSSSAFFTSEYFFIPAPHNNGTVQASAASSIKSGSASVTEVFPPINSGG